MIVYIDLDKTFCDFDSAVDFWRDKAVSEIEQNWPWSQKGFFNSLAPMPGAINFYYEFNSRCDLWFLTRPSIMNIHCYGEKAEWIYRHFGYDGLNKLILSPMKNIFIGDLLIDDNNEAGQDSFRGDWWRFGTGEYSNWDKVSKKFYESYGHKLN
jgi:5'(3')-deoxyribonucleotidase